MGVAPIMILVVMILVFSAITGFNVFLAPTNIVAILKQLAIPLCVALGLTYVIMIGSIDLSINGVVGMAGSLAGVFVANEVFNFNLGLFGVALAILSAVIVGFLIGVINVYLRVPGCCQAVHPGHSLHHLGCPADVRGLPDHPGIHRLRPSRICRWYQRSHSEVCWR